MLFNDLHEPLESSRETLLEQVLDSDGAFAEVLDIYEDVFDGLLRRSALKLSSQDQITELL